MKNRFFIITVFIFLFPAVCLSYNYAPAAELPEGVKKLLPENPDILACAAADLNGDKQTDYVVVIQFKDPDFDNDAAAKADGGEGLRLRELVIITAKDSAYVTAARSNRAVLCSGCGAKGEDPFLSIKALTKSFTILHKFSVDTGGTWGIASKFGYSKRDNKWQLVYFSGAGEEELKPGSFGLINLEDFDVNHYMISKKAEARPAPAEKTVFFEDDILYVDGGVAYTVRPDGTNKRYAGGDSFYRKISHPNLTPDKKEIYFVRNNDVYAAAIGGGNERKIFSDVLGASLYRYDDEGRVYAFVRSPDGKKYAAYGYPTNRDYNENNFYIMDSDGKNRKTIVKGDLYGGIVSPAWSPDSSKLAYYQGVTLKVMDINSGNTADLIYSRGTGLAWSKDGKRILTAVKGALDIIEVENKSIKEIKCTVFTGQGVLLWSADEKTAITYTSDYIFKISVEEGAQSKTVCGPENGLIEGVCW